MRKNKGLFLVLATLLAVTCLLVSCNSEVSENATGGGDKLVYATFGKGNTKALTGTTISTSYKLEEIGDVYWFYKASKADQGGRSGAQSSWYPVIPGQKGLDGVIGPFSTGLWNFEVIAYKDCSITAPTSPATSDASVTVGETTYYMNTAVFAGSVNGVSLATGTQANPDPINVTVTLQTSGSNGILTLDRDFVFEWAPGGGGTTDLTLKAVYGTGDSDYKTVALTWDSTSSKYVISSESETQWAIPAGDYEFDFEVYYTLNNVQYTVATASDVALKVYGGQETIIKASILEGNFVYAKINATVKSTAVANTVTTNSSTTFVTSYTPASIKSGSVSQTEVTSIKFEAGSLAATGTTTQIENTDTYSRIDSYKTEVSVSDIDAAQAQAANFTVAADATPVASIDASLFVTKSIVNSNNEVQENSTTTEKVTIFDSSVKVLTTYISKNLTDVAVYYNGSSVVPYTQGQTTGDGFDYEPSTGKLTVYTTHFSEFYVSSKSVAYIPETDTAYDTVKAAFGAVESGQTIQLLKDCSITENFVINDSNIVWDLNGKTVTYGKNYVDVASSIVIKNGDIVARNFTGVNAPIYVLPGANLVINDVNIEAKYTKDNEVKTAYAITGWNSGTQDAPIKLTINGGTFDGVVGTNGQFRYYNVEINGGTFNEGVYFPAYGEYVINGGVFNDPVEIKSGSLTVSGGEFNYADDPQAYTPYWNGTTVTGCSLAAVAYNGIDYGPSPSVTITGGTFAGKIGLARAYSDITYPEINASITVDLVYLGLESNYWINEASNSFFGGDGTSNNPYQISNARELARLAALINNEETRDAYKDKNYILTEDIDLSGKCWTPISYYYRKADSSKLFSGSFNGAGHTITGLNNEGLRYYTDVQIGANNTTPTDAIGEYSYGLFGTVYQATITNVVLTDVNILTGMGEPDQTDNKRYLGDSVGALVGCIKGTSDASKNSISNIQVSGTIKGYDGVGGVIGRIYGTNQFATVSNCSCSSATIEAIRRCGGVIGFTGYYPSSNVFSDCSFSGSVKCLGPERDFENNYQYYTAGLFYSECIEDSNNATSLDGFTNNGGTVTVVYSSTVSDNTPYVSGYKLKGGTYNSKPSASYIATGYSTYNTSDGKWIVASSNAFARITLNESGDVYYLTKNTEGPTTTSDWICLYDDENLPFNAGEYTLELLKDCSFVPNQATIWNLITFKGNNITFDLCGHTLTVNPVSYVFNDAGISNLIIQNGTVKNVNAPTSNRPKLMYVSSGYSISNLNLIDIDNE